MARSKYEPTDEEVEALKVRIDTLGHLIHTEHLAAELLHKRNYHLAESDLEEEGLKLEHLLHTGLTCAHCGGYIGFMWSGKDEDAPHINSQQAFRPPDDRKVRFIADDARCPMPKRLPVTVRFTCRSGRVALGNDFRTATGINRHRQKDEGLFFSINDYAGKVEYIKWFASHGYCTGRVYGDVWFIPVEGGLDVWQSNEGFDDDAKWDELEEAAIHQFSTDLWWFAIIDAEDLPEGGTDSYDREPGFMDLEPGEYEFTFHPEGNLAGTLRRVEDP